MKNPTTVIIKTSQLTKERNCYAGISKSCINILNYLSRLGKPELGVDVLELKRMADEEFAQLVK